MIPVDTKNSSEPIGENDFSSLTPIDICKDLETLIGTFAYTIFQGPYTRPTSLYEIDHSLCHKDVSWLYRNQEEVPEILKDIETGKQMFRTNDIVMSLLENQENILKKYQSDIDRMSNTFWYMMGPHRVYLT
ncbi:MAG: hypothetical protein ACI9S8_000437 [Chlamydiales bacterium]|jgi:hypothetical protein